MKYTLMVVAFTAIISLTYMTMVYLAHSEIGRDVSTYCNATIAAELQQRSNSIIGYISLGTLAISLLLTVLGVIATHRIAGPIFVMNRYLGVLCSGRIPKMRELRKNDELKALYRNLQAFVEQLGRQEKNEADRLKHAIDLLGPLASGRETQQCLDSLRTMYQRKCEAIEGSADKQTSPSQAVEQAA